MSAQIIDTIDGIITAEISNKVSPAELAAVQHEILKHLKEWNGGSILVICENFAGFTGGDWSDLSFQMAADDLIHKMAIIGEKEWEHLTFAFTGKAYRPFPIEFFQTGSLRDALAWLKSK